MWGRSYRPGSFSHLCNTTGSLCCWPHLADHQGSSAQLPVCSTVRCSTSILYHGCCRMGVPTSMRTLVLHIAFDILISQSSQHLTVKLAQVRQLREALRARAAAPPASAEVNAALQVCSCLLVQRKRQAAPQPLDVWTPTVAMHCNMTSCLNLM